MFKMKSSGASALLATVLTIAALSANATTIDALDRGWYRDNPSNGIVESIPFVQNYLVGRGVISSTPTATIRGEYRNFFAFDLSAYQGQTFGSAILSLYNPKYGDPETLGANPNGYGGFAQTGTNAFPYETYQLHAVTTNATDLLAGTAGRNGYNDLGDGLILGSYNATLLDNGTFIQIALNSSGLDLLNNAVGGMFLLGGNISTLGGGDNGSQTVFGFTNAPRLSDTQLIVTSAVPEPVSLVLFGIGLVGLGLSRRKKA